MKISVKVDYACRVMAELARLDGSGTLAQIEHLARAEAVPANFLAQILGKLRTAGLITSRTVRAGTSPSGSIRTAPRRPPESDRPAIDDIGVTVMSVARFKANSGNRT